VEVALAVAVAEEVVKNPEEFKSENLFTANYQIMEDNIHHRPYSQCNRLTFNTVFIGNNTDSA